MSKLTEDEILKSLKSLSNCFNNFVKVVHLNERLPQYSNILINNMRSEYGSKKYKLSLYFLESLIK
jgi:hypothetical protein